MNMAILITPNSSSINYTQVYIYNYTHANQQKVLYCSFALTMKKTSTAFYVYIFHDVESFIFLFYAKKIATRVYSFIHAGINISLTSKI